MVKNYHIVTFYICLLAFISGVFAVGQILGIINLYINWIAISMAILLSVVFGIILLKSAFQSLIGMLNKQDRIVLPKWVNIVAYGSGALILFAVLLLPLGFWPFSGIEHQLIWDAGLYHLPKAAIMVTTGSSWDLSIAYGEYPFGFESLIAFSFLFSRSGYLIGLVHAIILLFFICSLFLLTCKYSRIPVSYAFLLVVFLVASYDIFRLLSSNPFQYLRIIAFTIGMNDLFMASLIIASLLFIPINIGKNNKDY